MPHRITRVLIVWTLCLPGSVFAQQRKEDIHTDFVLYQNRVALANSLRERVIDRTFSTPPDSNTDYKYGSACDAISQFLFRSPVTDKGFGYLFADYDSLSGETKRSFLEAVYAVGKQDFAAPVRAVVDKETDPGLFALGAVYLYRSDTGVENVNAIKIRMVEQFPGYDTLQVLHELMRYLSDHSRDMAAKCPDIAALFSWRGRSGEKTIYSFQRWDRDYPGLAIVQNADGTFAHDGEGRIAMFRQLARSGSDLPYFITHGSTPQGIYSIQGLGVSHTLFIGPTPNIQLLLPFEDVFSRWFHESDSAAGPVAARDPVAGSVAAHDQLPAGDPGEDSLHRYLALIPPPWRNYAPMMEAWAAGRIGRNEIIAHGTTIDPEYFAGMPFYPLTPTTGCLCAKEIWNPTTGRLLESEQYNLETAFRTTPGDKGYLYVIDVGDQRKPVSREEVEAWVRQYEKERGK